MARCVIFSELYIEVFCETLETYFVTYVSGHTKTLALPVLVVLDYLLCYICIRSLRNYTVLTSQCPLSLGMGGVCQC